MRVFMKTSLFWCVFINGICLCNGIGSREKYACKKNKYCMKVLCKIGEITCPSISFKHCVFIIWMKHILSSGFKLVFRALTAPFTSMVGVVLEDSKSRWCVSVAPNPQSLFLFWDILRVRQWSSCTPLMETLHRLCQQQLGKNMYIVWLWLAIA